MPENLEKLRSTELYDAPLEGSTIFLYRSSLGRTSSESCRLAELKYAIFSGTGRKTKKLRCSKLFLLTVSKHGLLEESTFLFQYSSITRTPLERSRLGELKYAILDLGSLNMQFQPDWPKDEQITALLNFCLKT